MCQGCHLRNWCRLLYEFINRQKNARNYNYNFETFIGRIVQKHKHRQSLVNKNSELNKKNVIHSSDVIH